MPKIELTVAAQRDRLLVLSSRKAYWGKVEADLAKMIGAQLAAVEKEINGTLALIGVPNDKRPVIVNGDCVLWEDADFMIDVATATLVPRPPEQREEFIKQFGEK